MNKFTYLTFISVEICSNVLFLVSGTKEKIKSTDMAHIMLNTMKVKETPRLSEIIKKDFV